MITLNIHLIAEIRCICDLVIIQMQIMNTPNNSLTHSKQYTTHREIFSGNEYACLVVSLANNVKSFGTYYFEKWTNTGNLSWVFFWEPMRTKKKKWVSLRLSFSDIRQKIEDSMLKNGRPSSSFDSSCFLSSFADDLFLREDDNLGIKNQSHDLSTAMALWRIKAGLGRARENAFLVLSVVRNRRRESLIAETFTPLLERTTTPLGPLKCSGF